RTASNRDRRSAPLRGSPAEPYSVHLSSSHYNESHHSTSRSKPPCRGEPSSQRSWFDGGYSWRRECGFSRRPPAIVCLQEQSCLLAQEPHSGPRGRFRTEASLGNTEPGRP